MSDTEKDDIETQVSDWWQTEIIEMEPGIIRYRGYAIEDLIGNVSFSQMIWLMLRGEIPSDGQSNLLEHALTAAVDHGPQAPSIAIARMAVTCGVGLNNAMASALNVLGEIHGGAGEQAVEFFNAIHKDQGQHETLRDTAKHHLQKFFDSGQKFVPGYGHRFHPTDPRAPRLLELVDNAAKAGDVSGDYAKIARETETQINIYKNKHIPLNIDGATAVIYAELGFPPALARGLFCLSRSVGILSHAWEQKCQGGRNKGPIPRDMTWTYSGPTYKNYKKND